MAQIIFFDGERLKRRLPDVLTADQHVAVHLGDLLPEFYVWDGGDPDDVMTTLAELNQLGEAR